MYYIKHGEAGKSTRHYIGGVDSMYRIREYTGEWVNNVREGNGRITYMNGDTLEGTFANGQPHGMMVYTFVSTTGRTR